MKKFLLLFSVYGCIMLAGAAVNQVWEHLPSGPPAAAAGTLVFARGHDIWMMDATGSSPIQLTHEVGDNFADNPRFSPDGGTIAYVRHQAQRGVALPSAELRVMRIDGSGDQSLVAPQRPGENIDTPAWAADSQSVFFAHEIGGSLSVDEVNLADANIRTAVQNAIMPSISASGKLAWVAFNPADATFKLCVTEDNAPDIAAPIAVVSSDDFEAIYSPRVSPDGQRIVFSAWGRTNTDVPPKGASLAALLEPLQPAVAEAHGLAWDVWTIGVDGSDLKKIVAVGTDEQSLAWMPDGQAIAVARVGGLYVARPDGGGLQQILAHGLSAGLDWK